MWDLSDAWPVTAIGLGPRELSHVLAGLDLLLARPADLDDWTTDGMLDGLEDLDRMPGYDPAEAGTIMVVAAGRCDHVEVDSDGELLAVFAGDGSDLDPDRMRPFERPMPAGYRFRITLDTVVLVPGAGSLAA